ncbi:gamma-glutamyl-hercynylcysteine sulfoxide hydrolase [Rhizocola hellebori]|uniref:Gamma-glutamyl-hercynylcysteine sulfoxide hydrolase n=1 Tax=Rhizocola hellebori TaxID=1392758 RepID=A0A8J3VG80_9ACTN|nr:ergothioneine biosynthesis protein EgtC [Rhizocola hellebori]GIH05170.1 gamma-glutamyl-hercynylcysteine sulfoxide hydrolase [Rhizocola hellebori]
MCRHLLYLGEPARVSSLVLEPSHSLLRQSWAPRLAGGHSTVNADGFGIGWYGQDGPVRYRRSTPMWGDENLPALANATVATAILAAVRSATPGMPVGDAACAPFGSDGWLFSHNGFIAGWPDSIAKLAERLPITDLLTVDAPTDSAFTWTMVRHLLRSGEQPDAALITTVAEIAAAAPASRLNFLLTDGVRGYASCVGHSLFVRCLPGQVVIASEPFDDHPAWTSIPDNHLLTTEPSGYTLEEL